MEWLGTQMMRVGACAAVVGVVFAASGSGTAAADPANNTSPFEIVSFAG